jgi:DNA-directed RNA polymerase subunit RPC12/RpoP
MSKTSQEFYCGECRGYFVVRLNMSINHEAEIVCPNCGHEHRRSIVDGHILENGRYRSESRERVITTKANYSKEPVTEKMRQAHARNGSRRDGVLMTEAFIHEQWMNVVGRERGEM